MKDFLFSLFNIRPSGSFTGLDDFRKYQQDAAIKSYISQGILQGVGAISNFISSQVQASAMDDYYSALKAQQAKARKNVLELTKSEGDSSIKAAQLRATVFEQNANQDITSAINGINSSINDLEQSILSVNSQKQRASQSYAVSNLENTGTVRTVIADINQQGMRDVNNNYRQSLNNINSYISRAAETRLTAAADLLAAKEKAKYAYTAAEINTQGVL